MATVFYGGEPSDVAMVGSRVVTGRPAVVWTSSAKTSQVTTASVVDTTDGSSVASGTVNGTIYTSGVVYPDRRGIYEYKIEDGPGSTFLEVHGTDQLLRMVGFSADGYIVTGAGTDNQGDPGPGVATGGSTGQVLTKASGTDYDTAWATPSNGLPSGGSTDQALVKSSGTDYAVTWATVPTDASVVHKATTETVTGDKTFSGVVNVPAPTVGTHAANKTYADGLVALLTLNGHRVTIDTVFPGSPTQGDILLKIG